MKRFQRLIVPLAMKLACAAQLTSGGMILAQTKVRLSGQADAADFSQFTYTRPAKVGTTLPGSCLTGEAFFKSDASPGSNLYICASSAWFPIQTGNTVTSVSALSDLRVTATTTVVSVAAGKVQLLDTAGRYTVTDIVPATVTRVGGTDTGALRIEVASNAGAPFLRCLWGSGLTSSNYTVSGCTAIAQNSFSIGAQPLASVVITGGNWGTPSDQRAFGGVANYDVGTGLTKAGNMLSLNSGVVGMLSGANTWSSPQTFTPSATTAGVRALCAALPSSPANGAFACDSGDSNRVKVYSNGAWVTVGAYTPEYFRQMELASCLEDGTLLPSSDLYFNATDTPGARSCFSASGQGYSTLADGQTTRWHGRWAIPSDAGASLTATVAFGGDGNANGGNVRLAFAWACASAGDPSNSLPTFSADSGVTVSEGSVANGYRYASFAPVDISGCAGKVLYFKFGRDGMAGADTSTNGIHLFGVGLRVQ